MNEPIESTSKLYIEKETPIVQDYNQTDYSQFWTGFGKSLLDKAEQRIVQKLIPPSPGWFIDLGGGYGRLVPTYMNSNRKIVLVDYALNLLEEAARRHPQENIHFIAADAYHLPFRDNVFDCGLSVRLFHHINAPQAFMSEISRTFREGAGLVLSYSNKRNLLRILKNGSKAFEHDHEKYGEMLFGTHPAHFGELCRNAKFVVDTTLGTGVFDQTLRAMPSLERLFARMPLLSSPLLVMENIADFILGWLRFLPIHFALLYKTNRNKTSPADSKLYQHLIEILACPHCQKTHLSKQDKAYTCLDCGKTYPICNKFLDFRLGEING